LLPTTSSRISILSARTIYISISEPWQTRLKLEMEGSPLDPNRTAGHLPSLRAILATKASRRGRLRKPARLPQMITIGGRRGWGRLGGSSLRSDQLIGSGETTRRWRRSWILKKHYDAISEVIFITYIPTNHSYFISWHHGLTIGVLFSNPYMDWAVSHKSLHQDSSI
jgi:hypothetical protein